MGVIQTVARGARRPKSPFAGRLDLFFEAEIAVAFSRKSNLHTLRELTILEPFAGIRTGHLRTQTAAYFVELVELCTETDHHEPHIFELLRRAFGFLDQTEPRRRAVTFFETELARIAGVHDARRSEAANALGTLFGKLPLGRAALLKALAP
jgi:DNA repair protein RecO (recombination protein O)